MSVQPDRDCAAENAALRAEVEKFKAKIEQLRAVEQKLEATCEQLIGERDEYERLLDQFAYAIAPIEVIGEHSSGNDPWTNALDMVTPAAKVERLEAEIERLRELRWDVWAGIAEVLAVGVSRWPFGSRSHRAVSRRLADAANRLIRSDGGGS